MGLILSANEVGSDLDGTEDTSLSSSQVKGNFTKRFAVGKQLGRGSQGRVNICHDRTTGAAFAVKILDRSNKSAWATYKREVELCQLAAGKNVLVFLEEFVDEQFYYIVMEKFEGHVRKGLKWVSRELGEEVIVDTKSLGNIIRQALSATRHLHSVGVIHRDVKAHNLLIDTLDIRDPRCRVVLADFGLARRLEPGRFLCAQVGTRKYWAPELYDKKYWHVVDVFALGVLMFLALCSSYPYLDEEHTRWRNVFDEELVPPLPDPDALDFMKLTLIKDPLKRPSSDELGHHPWMLKSGGLIEQALGSKFGQTADCNISISRKFGPKVLQPPADSLELQGDNAEGIEAGLELLNGNLKEELTDDLGSTTLHQHTLKSDESSPGFLSKANSCSPLNFRLR